MTPSPTRGLLRTIIDTELALAAERIERRFLEAMAGGSSIDTPTPAAAAASSGHALGRRQVRELGGARATSVDAAIEALIDAGRIVDRGTDKQSKFRSTGGRHGDDE